MTTLDKDAIINDQMLTTNISQLLIKISMFKKSIVGNLLKENPNPNIKYNADDLIKIIREFISNWDEYGLNAYQKMQTINPKVGFDAIPYNDVKKFIYSNYDYKSISDFVDGLFKGIDNKELEDKDDIKSFFNYVTNLAFSGRGENPADLIQEVLEKGNMNIDIEPVDENEVNYFNLIKKYNIFNRIDKDVLTKECENILKIIPSYVKDSNNFKSITNIFMNGLLSIMDFISYALVAFATRVYIITRYINLYAEGSKDNNVEESEELMTESMYSEIKFHLDFPYEELDFHDYKKWKDVKNILREIMNMHLEPNEKLPVDQITENVYDKSLSYTSLYKIIMSRYDEYIDGVEFSNIIEKNIHELNELVFRLKNAFVASHQALSYEESSKQGLLATIKKITAENETANSYKILLNHLIFFSIRFMDNIVNKINIIHYARENQYSLKGFNPSIINDFSTISKILDELYRDFGSAIYYRIKYIRKKIVQFKGLEAKKFADQMKINVPGLPSSDLSKDDTEMMGLPDTARGTTELLVKMGAFNECENQLFHYEYLKSLPECDEYFSEAITWQTLLTQIKALFDRMIKSSQKLLNSASFKLAITWVNNNETKLKNQITNFKGGMKVLPYKDNIDVNSVFKNLNDGFTAFENQYIHISKQEDVDNIIKEFYKLPGNNIASTTLNNDQYKTMFKNSLLFTDNNIQERELTSGDIQDYLNIWISTVKSAANVHRELINSINQISARQQKIIDMLNSKTTGSTPITSTSSQTPSSNPPEINSGETPNQQPQPTSTTGNQANDNLKQQTVTGITSAVQQILGDTYSYITNAIFNQYNYIKEFNKLTTQTNLAQ